MITSVKNIVQSTVRVLNQPTVKEGVKNIAGSITFIFGIAEVYDIYQIARGREISTEQNSNSPPWMRVANKVIIVCAKISIVLSAGVSRPGMYIISSLVGRVFSTEQLNRAFGPNTIFTVNPWHPRHVVSIVAVILALPSVLQSTMKGARWAYRKITQHQTQPTADKVETVLTDNKIRFMTLFNTVLSRPTLHIVNKLVR